MRFWKLQGTILAALALTMLPLLWWFKLPPNIGLLYMGRVYFVSLALQSALALMVFYLVERTSFFACFRDWRVFSMSLALAAFLWWLTGGAAPLFFEVLSVAILVMCGYPRINSHSLKQSWPALYFFTGLVIAFSYSSMAPALVEFSKFDRALLKADRVLLFGHSVAQFSHWMLSLNHAGEILERIYYALFAVIGATLLWLLFEARENAAVNFVADILTCYGLTFMIYCTLPALGPFVFDSSPARLESMIGQNSQAAYLTALRANHSLFFVHNSYFIAFPSMHMAEAALVWFYLRSWPRLAWLVLAYNAALVIAILGLQWHYAVDLLGGTVIAAMAVVIRNALDRSRPAGVGEFVAPPSEIDLAAEVS